MVSWSYLLSYKSFCLSIDLRYEHLYIDEMPLQIFELLHQFSP